jgi:hypothetical protein
VAVEDYEVEIATPGGVKQFYIATLTSLDMTMTTNGWGVCSLEFPAVDQRQRFSIFDFGKNYRIRVKRKGVLLGGASYLIRYRKRTFEADAQIITLQGFHANWLLSTRPIAYYASSPQAEATTEACDDAMKRLVRDNLGEDAQHADRDSTREGNTAPDYSAYLSVAADTTEAPTTSRGFARQNLYNVLLDFAADSYAQGTSLFFGFEEDTGGQLVFRTRPHQWGAAAGLILSLDYQNLENATQEWDWREETTVGYALGSDTESNRNVKMYVADAANETIFNWIEKTINASSLTNATSLTSEARALTQEYRAKEQVMGELVQKVGSMYQDDWNFGDRLIISLEGVNQAIWASKLRISLKGQEETITPTLELVQ